MFSSEEQAAKNYLWVLAVILLFTFSSMVLISWVIDPFGVLRKDRGFPELCAEGIKTTDDRTSIPLLPLKTQFSEAIIGNSRIKRGFTRESFEGNALKKTANLGISSLTMEELYQLSAPLIQSKQLDTIWIGLDFGMFGKRNPDAMKVYETSQTSYDRLSSYLSGALSFKAWRETTFVIRRFHNCRSPVRDYQGFIISGKYWHKRNNAWNEKTTGSDSVELTRRRLLKEFSETDNEQASRYQYHLTLLEELLKKAGNNSVQLNLFINPSHPDYFDILDKAGKLNNYRQWKLDIETVIQNAPRTAMGPRFMDFSGWYVHKDFMPLGCRDNFAPPCPFSDFTHYRPQIGMQILREFQK
ncbi:hypothetical protein [Porticoccus sp.]